MQTRFVTIGTNKEEQAVWLAYELHEEAFRLDLHIVPRKALDNDQADVLTKQWVEGTAFEFPEGTVLVNPNLNEDSILPDYIHTTETGKIRSKQNEWAYQLLTNKLWESYLIELEELKTRAGNLQQYDRQLFDQSKSFWERVLEHRKERDLSQNRLDQIKEDVNVIFEKLKTFRKTESAQFEEESTKAREELQAKLEAVKQKMANKPNFRELFEELKAIQTQYRNQRWSKGDEKTVKLAFDNAFNNLSEQRNNFHNNANQARIDGLNDVLVRMEKGLERDKKDLEQLNKKANSSGISSMELQLNKLKVKMLNETIAGKEEKVADIKQTLEKILRKEKPKKEADVYQPEQEKPQESEETQEPLEGSTESV